MRILVETSNYFGDNENNGDRALFRVLVARLKGLWPGAEVFMVTRDVEALGRAARNARAVLVSVPAKYTWLENLGRPHAGGSVGPGVIEVRDETRWREFVAGMDLVIASGGGFFSDNYAEHAVSVLKTLRFAQLCGKPTAIVGCGFEPVQDSHLCDWAAECLPHVGAILCRDDVIAPGVLHGFGVNEERVTFSYDDAAALAHCHRSETLGRRLGFNLRRSEASMLTNDASQRLRRKVFAWGGKIRAPVQPLPISVFGPSDLEACGVDTRQSTRLYSVLCACADCRVVVTGSYHAAVFALAQGVPVIVLSASSHYAGKLKGLEALNGEGCRFLSVDTVVGSDVLERTMDELWSAAPDLRGGMLSRTARLLQSQWEAYRNIANLADGRWQPEAPALEVEPRNLARWRAAGDFYVNLGRSLVGVAPSQAIS